MPWKVIYIDVALEKKKVLKQMKDLEKDLKQAIKRTEKNAKFVVELDDKWLKKSTKKATEDLARSIKNVSKKKANIILNESDFKAQLNNIELKARDTWKKLDKAFLTKLDVDYADLEIAKKQAIQLKKEMNIQFNNWIISKKAYNDSIRNANRLTKATTEAGRKLENYKNTWDETLSRWRKWVNWIKGSVLSLKWLVAKVWVAFATYFSARKVEQLSNSFTNLNNRLKQVSQWEDLSILRDKIFKAANDARVWVEEYTSAFVRFDLVNKQIWWTQEETLLIMDSLTKWLSASWAAASEVNSVMLQLSQAFGSWRLAWDEFRSVSENMPILLDVLAEKLWVQRWELKELAAQWLITSDVLKTALIWANEKLNESFNKTKTTIGQAMVQATNRFIQKYWEMDEVYNITDKLVKIIWVLWDLFLDIIVIIWKLTWFIINNAKVIKELTIAVIALVSAKALFGLTKLLKWLPILFRNVAIAQWIMTTATNLTTWALVRMSAASLAALWPLAALAGALYTAINAYRVYLLYKEKVALNESRTNTEKTSQDLKIDNLTKSKEEYNKLEKANIELAKKGDKQSLKQIETNKLLMKQQLNINKVSSLLLQKDIAKTDKQKQLIDDKLHKINEENYLLKEQIKIKTWQPNIDEIDDSNNGNNDLWWGWGKVEVDVVLNDYTIEGIDNMIDKLNKKLYKTKIWSADFIKIKKEISTLNKLKEDANKTEEEKNKEIFESRLSKIEKLWKTEQWLEEDLLTDYKAKIKVLEELSKLQDNINNSEEEQETITNKIIEYKQDIWDITKQIYDEEQKSLKDLSDKIDELQEKARNITKDKDTKLAERSIKIKEEKTEVLNKAVNISTSNTWERIKSIDEDLKWELSESKRNRLLDKRLVLIEKFNRELLTARKLTWEEYELQKELKDLEWEENTANKVIDSRKTEQEALKKDLEDRKKILQEEADDLKDTLNTVANADISSYWDKQKKQLLDAMDKKKAELEDILEEIKDISEQQEFNIDTFWDVEDSQDDTEIDEILDEYEEEKSKITEKLDFVKENLNLESEAYWEMLEIRTYWEEAFSNFFKWQIDNRIAEQARLLRDALSVAKSLNDLWFFKSPTWFTASFQKTDSEWKTKTIQKTINVTNNATINNEIDQKKFTREITKSIARAEASWNIY